MVDTADSKPASKKIKGSSPLTRTWIFGKLFKFKQNSSNLLIQLYKRALRGCLGIKLKRLCIAKS